VRGVSVLSAILRVATSFQYSGECRILREPTVLARRIKGSFIGEILGARTEGTGCKDHGCKDTGCKN
jgi:hypothetical protein